MKRKITGVCLALAVTLGMWCGAQTSIEFASAYAESEEVTGLEDILGDAESENTGETLGDNENGMGDNDTGEIIVDESEEDENMKKTYKIDVDCANCANKMEEAAKNTSGVKDATVNFMTLKLIVEFEDGAEPASVMKDVLKSCKKVEDDCEIFL